MIQPIAMKTKITRIAITHHPQCLLVEYITEEEEHRPSKLYHKRITFRDGIIQTKYNNNRDTKNNEEAENYQSAGEAVLAADMIAKDLSEAYPEYLGSEQVPTHQLVRLIQSLKDGPPVTGSTNAGVCAKPTSEPPPGTTGGDNHDIDLNKVSDQELLKAKQRMDVIFDNQRLRPGDVRYEYDKRVDYDPESDSSWD